MNEKKIAQEGVAGNLEKTGVRARARDTLEL